MKIAVSACLLGRNCKYNGGNNYDERLSACLAGHEVVEVCPEVEGGLSTPRSPAELRCGRVVNVEGADVTAQFELGARRCLELVEDCELAVLKSKSPSCGVHQVYDGSFSGRLVPGKGVFAALLEKAGIRAVEPGEYPLAPADGSRQHEGEDACAPVPSEGPVLEGDNLRVFPRALFGTAYVYDVETEDGSPVRLLEVGGAFESATYLDERRFQPTFAYYKAFDHLFEAFPQPERVLMLGGGGFSYPKHFVASQPFGALDVVEIDPVITRIARKHFFLGELMERFRTEETSRLRIVTADACSYVKECAGGKAASPRYDAVINDSFSGGEPTEGLMSEEGLRAIKAILRKGGLLMANVVCDAEEDARPLMAVLRCMSRVFAHTWVIPCPDEVFGGEDNNLVIASDTAHAFSDCLPAIPAELL